MLNDDVEKKYVYKILTINISEKFTEDTNSTGRNSLCTSIIAKLAHSTSLSY